MRIDFNTLSTTCTIFAISDNDMFVPQKTDFAYHFFRTAVNAFPTCLATPLIYTYVFVQNFTSTSISTSPHFLFFFKNKDYICIINKIGNIF